MGQGFDFLNSLWSCSNDITEFGSAFNGEGEHFSPTDIPDPPLSVKSLWDACKSKLWLPFQIQFSEVLVPVMPNFYDPHLNKDKKTRGLWQGHTSVALWRHDRS